MACYGCDFGCTDEELIDHVVSRLGERFVGLVHRQLGLFACKSDEGWHLQCCMHVMGGEDMR